MKKEVSAEAVRNQLERIVNSRVFSRSDSNQRLLTYLTEATLNGENPKEFTIGVDVFNRPVDESSNSNVRVYIHKLRKKLEKYYTDEGYNDPVYFSLPSGSYTLSFSTKHRKKNNSVVLYMGIAVLVLANLLTLFYFKMNKTPLQKLAKTTFWKALVDNGKPTVLVAGDYFFFHKKIPTHNFTNIRDTYINSEPELKRHIENNELDAAEYSYTNDLAYMPRDALFSMPNIIPVFHENKVNYHMLVSADFDWKIFKDQNLVYIGSMKNLKDLVIVFEKLNLSYRIEPERLIYNTEEGEHTLDISYGAHLTVDPTVVIRIPGPDGNVIHMFVSNHDIGCISATEYFSNLDNVKNFEKQYLKETPYFMAVFKAEGIGRTDISFNLVDIEPIRNDELENLWH